MMRMQTARRSGSLAEAAAAARGSLRAGDSGSTIGLASSSGRQATTAYRLGRPKKQEHSVEAVRMSLIRLGSAPSSTDERRGDGYPPAPCVMGATGDAGHFVRLGRPAPVRVSTVRDL